LFRVADPRRLEIAAAVPRQRPAIRDGDRVELVTREGQTVACRVRAATGVVDPQSRTATVIVTPLASTAALAPGQLVQAHIFASGGAARNSIMIPQDAVQTLGKQEVVFVRTVQGFRAQPVRIAGRAAAWSPSPTGSRRARRYDQRLSDQGGTRKGYGGEE
jgi:cobalt-zinc-cadmium efflux system membrane fusion protein